MLRDVSVTSVRLASSIFCLQIPRGVNHATVIPLVPEMETFLVILQWANVSARNMLEVSLNFVKSQSILFIDVAQQF